MPQLGETVTEGTIVRWGVAAGDAIGIDDVLFEVSTDKVDTEVPAASAGVVREVLVAEGETVPIGTPLAVITATAEEIYEIEGRAPTPVAVAVAPPAPAAPAALAAPAPARTEGAGFLSPVVRRLLAEHGLDPAAVVGSGTDGRITRADVLAAAANRHPVGNGTAPVAPAGIEPGPDDDVIEFTRARRTTATNMVRSLAVSAHTLVVVEVDYAGVDVARRTTSPPLSYLPFVARAVVDAIGEFPHVNASVGDDQLIVHRRVHLGVAVDVEHAALVVPVVRDAHELRLRALADAVADLAARARAKRLGSDDLTGGTFTITNVGRYGTLVTAPVINQPEVAIVSTDGVRMRPVALPTATGEWTMTIHPVGNLCLSFDHRAYDGAYASAFLARVRDILETRTWSEEL